MSSNKKSESSESNVTRIKASGRLDSEKRTQIIIGVTVAAIVIIIMAIIMNGIKSIGSNSGSGETTGLIASQDDKESSESQEKPIDAIARQLADEAISERFSDSNLCNATYEVDGDNYLNERGIARGVTTTFIESGKLVFKDKNCGTYMLAIEAEGVDSRGNDSTFRFATFTADRDVFSAYNWPELKGTSVGAQLDRDGILRLPLNTRMSVDDFWYN